VTVAENEERLLKGDGRDDGDHVCDGQTGGKSAVTVAENEGRTGGKGVVTVAENEGEIEARDSMRSLDTHADAACSPLLQSGSHANKGDVGGESAGGGDGGGGGEMGEVTRGDGDQPAPDENTERVGEGIAGGGGGGRGGGGGEERGVRDGVAGKGGEEG